MNREVSAGSDCADWGDILSFFKNSKRNLVLDVEPLLSPMFDKVHIWSKCITCQAHTMIDDNYLKLQCFMIDDNYLKLQCFQNHVKTFKMNLFHVKKV